MKYIDLDEIAEAVAKCSSDFRNADELAAWELLEQRFLYCKALQMVTDYQAISERLMGYPLGFGTAALIVFNKL